MKFLKLTQSLAEFSTLRLVLGDQLNASHSWFREQDQQVVYLIAEMRQETDYVRHHVQKVLSFFAAMEAFATALINAGHQVMYLTLDDTQHSRSLQHLLDEVSSACGISHFEYIQPDEYRLSEQLKTWVAQHPEYTSRCVDSEHFYIPFHSLAEYGQAGKHQRMEFFYRKLRKRFAVLMDGDKPTGGQWNYDLENRQKLNSGAIKVLPSPLLFANDVCKLRARLTRHQVSTIGVGSDRLLWPINRQQALELLRFFCRELLPNFGRFQDAMIAKQPGFADPSWSLYHSRLSFCLNSKILTPRQVVNMAINAYIERPDVITLPQVEGFVRQILGWREFVRMIYWLNMPNYASLNGLAAQRDLPSWFWNGKTQMNCMQQTIRQSLDYGYAHHIQRLMVTGNFCLLAGIDPDQVDNWYLGIYVDGIEWVEMPNTRGMSQFADGGILASKAYSASGNYLNKMSNYCKSCHYQMKLKVGDNACPFNSLYWRFMVEHQSTFSRNPRNAMVYNNWRRQSVEMQQQVIAQADYYLANIEDL